MRPLRVATIWLLLAIGLAPASNGAGLGEGELTLFGAAASGDYGTDFETGSEWLTLRYVGGDDLQIRADLSMVRVETLSTVGLTGLGPTATGTHVRQGGRNGQGGNGEGSQNGSQPGTGPGADAVSMDTLTRDRTTGLGDLFVGLSKRVAGGGVRLFRLDTSLEVKIPTASEEDYLGTGEWDYRIGLAGEYRFWSATTFGGVGWNRLGDPDWIEFNDVLDVLAGVDSDPLLGERLIVSGWVEAWQEAVDGTGHRAALGVGLQSTGRVRWRLQLRTGLTDAAPDLGVLFGVSFGVAPPGPGIRGPQL
jgi:hypothetical protein